MLPFVLFCDFDLDDDTILRYEQQLLDSFADAFMILIILSTTTIFVFIRKSDFIVN